MSSESTPRVFDRDARRALYDQRVLVLDGALDDDNGTLLAAQLVTLALDDPGRDIALWIHSPGGSVPGMLAIRDTMRLLPCDVATLALGMAASANVHYADKSRVAMFEPVHGSAPPLVGKDLANPIASFLTVGMLLAHLGYDEEESRIERWCAEAVTTGNCTPDVGGTKGTQATATWILDRLRSDI